MYGAINSIPYILSNFMQPRYANKQVYGFCLTIVMAIRLNTEFLIQGFADFLRLQILRACALESRKQSIGQVLLTFLTL